MDPFDLARFRKAQEGVIATALAEMRAGAKRSHWMWFVFPQLRELGRSETARFYGIGSREEAVAYLADPVLGPRLIEACEAALAPQGVSARTLMGSPDDLKLRSCVTLFGALPEPPQVFGQVLARYFDGQGDERTLELLERGDR